MSDLAATNCGCDRCENDCDRGNTCGFFGGNNNCSCIIWLLVLSCIFGNGGWGGCGGAEGCGWNRWGGDNSCLILLILLFCCGNN